MMQRLEMNVNQRLLAGMVAQTVGVTMISEVGDDRAGQRHESVNQYI